MEKQSSRAEITRWGFTNEYHYGDFHGKAEEMLRRGYDVHLHYANFGVRRLMIRLPGGLPCDHKTFAAFHVTYGVEWHADKAGKAGSLDIRPQTDGDGYEEELFDVDDWLPKLAPLREQLLAGDLRALYLAWLACGEDDEKREPPVPAGLGKLTPALKAFAEFYEIDLDLIAAAAERSPPAPSATGGGDKVKEWIARQSAGELRALVGQLLADDAAGVRAETLARIRDETGVAPWPMAEATRTRGQLRDAAKAQAEKRVAREQKASDAARRKRYAAIAADPAKVIAEVRELVKQRSTRDYDKAAAQLVELRAALKRAGLLG